MTKEEMEELIKKLFTALDNESVVILESSDIASSTVEVLEECEWLEIGTSNALLRR